MGFILLSKAGVNMFANLYSNEMLNTKILAVAPGVIKHQWLIILDLNLMLIFFPSAKKLNTGTVQTPNETAVKL